MLCLIFGRDPLPFVGGGDASAGQVGDPKAVRVAKFTIAGATALGDFEETQRDTFADCGRDRMAIDAIGFEVGKRDGQIAVVGSAMSAVFALNTRQNTVGG